MSRSRVVSWYLTYTRILGRGYTLDDPDVMSLLAVLGSAIIYVIYNAQITLVPESYETNVVYKAADIVGLIEACFCVLACLRDDNWFWFCPLAGQYGVALGRVQVETKALPQFGRPPILITRPCRRGRHGGGDRTLDGTCSPREMITVPIFVSPICDRRHAQPRATSSGSDAFD